MLIDHELNIKEGIDYVKKALKQDSKSAFFIDSLAWGEYKLGNCKKAHSLIQKVLKLKSINKEVKNHIEAIDRCLNKKKDK